MGCIWPQDQTLDTVISAAILFLDPGDVSCGTNRISEWIYQQVWVSMLWFDPNRKFLIFWTNLITYSALHSFCQASWYFTGSSCRVAGSKSAESIYWKMEIRKVYRIDCIQGFTCFYTAEGQFLLTVTISSLDSTLTLTSSLWLMARAECSRALMTEAYESENFVYFPTRAMEQCSNSLSDLRHKKTNKQHAKIKLNIKKLD